LDGRIGECEPLAENMKKFKEAVKPIIAGINPKEVKFNAHIAASIGFNFRPIEGVEDVYKKEVHTINHKPGKVLLIDFWLLGVIVVQS
jgi:hypothetical protein